MSFTLLLNSSNVIGSNNNTYQYKFVNGNFVIPEGSEMAISQITIPYSWYNITNNYYNNTFNIKWVNAGATVQTFTLPNGFYDIDSISAYIQQICIQNGWYLVDSTGSNYYYIVLSTNSNYYKIQLLLMNVPVSLPSGWSAPSNWAGYPASTLAPQFSLNASGSIGSLIGFAGGGSWGFGSSSVSVLSTLTPNLTPVNSLTVRCNLVKNGVAMPSDILDSIPINSTFGSNINYAPNYEKWVKISSGSYSTLNITFMDQNLNMLYALDPNVAITLLIKTPNK
jgi:hypothetical protein